MRSRDHWCFVYFWNFGAWKTLWVSQETILEKEKKPTFVISNNPYYYSDLYYSTRKELEVIINHLERFATETNFDLLNYFNTLNNQKNIVVIIDEWHLYFDSRHFSSKSPMIEKIWLILTQSRKRKIKFKIITQRPSSIDIRFRKLADYIVEYKTFFHWLFTLKYIYEAVWDSSYVEDPSDHMINAHRISTTIFMARTWFVKEYSFINNSKWDKLRDQQYISHHIVWLKDAFPYNLTYENFISQLIVNNVKK